MYCLGQRVSHGEGATPETNKEKYRSRGYHGVADLFGALDDLIVDVYHRR